jgi:alkyl sulfatase BDS1-like metallo-beta-lactamase superfamily hydrolase
MNKGLTQAEIAEALVPPPSLTDEWYNHGYYGTYSHNSKAIYQRYLGWYDANPANLNPWPPVERARKYVAAMGGRKKVIALAQKAMSAGDYRWSSDLLNQLVFADPSSTPARALLADSFEQQGYQSESGIWRNQFLVAANELRSGYKPSSTNTQSADMIAAVPTQTLLDSVATRFDPARAGGRKLAINLMIPERKESVGVELTGTTMIARMEPLSTPAVTITAPRRILLGMLFLKLPLDQLEMAGLKIEGDRAAAQAWLDALDPLSSGFNIVEP